VERIGDEIELTIADDGIGMPDKVVAKLPEKRGADYVAIFVRQLGGTLVVSGPEQKGTAIKVRLPLLVVPSGGVEPLAA
jgi:two-component sensor histidine kinase